MTTAVPQSPYRLTETELALWLKFIEHHVGFVLPTSQQIWIKGIIERYLFRLKLQHNEFFLQVTNDRTLFHQFFDDILIPRTQFFRHQTTFDVITRYAEAWKLRQPPSLSTMMPIPAAQVVPDFRVWSVGCATGQEPISLALTLAQVFTPITRFGIWASDYHQKALASARQGLYDLSQQTFIPSDYHNWLQVKDEKNFTVLSPLLERITYFSFNLMQRQIPLPILFKQCQIIICQNVLIYFRQFEQRDIIRFLSQYLADDGILIMGVSEAAQLHNPSLKKLVNTKVDILIKANAPSWISDVLLET